MHLSILTISALLYGFGAVATEPVGTWVVSDVHRTRTQDNATCHWSLRISQQQAAESELCDFEYSAPAGQACSAMSFAGLPCSANSSFKINGGSDSRGGFVVLTLYDEAVDGLAYFGFTDAELDGGAPIPSQVDEAYRRASVRGRGRRDDDDVGDAVAGASSWLVQDLMRVVNNETNTIDLAFSVSDAAGNNSVPCRLVVDVPQGTDPATYQWYAQRCQGSEFSASWGYQSSGDAGIMTLVSPAKDKNSFFGWNDISKKTILDDAGPNPVMPCDCR
ncbi:hypothetical protein F4779DRAFT_635359 [Xylariaceae sp. FL0662B]|nr:hypothetical protein F4779DRAFT_635359 [Xylariaceae sp. FL0662B]